MVEQTHSVEDHGDAVTVAGFDDVVVTDRAARFSDIADAALMGTFDIVAKREEGIGTK